MRAAALVLLVVNVVYATASVVTRIALDGLPPALLGFARLAIAALVLLPLARGERLPAGEGLRVVTMGVIGFAMAFALMNWGITYSSATNAALLIIVEPLTMLLFGSALLGERLTRREALGAALAVLGALIVVADGIPGVTLRVLPRWRGDVLLAAAGVAYAVYSLLGRPVLTPSNTTAVTARSILSGAVAMAPLVVLEWAAGVRPTPSVAALAGVLYLGVVITALGYLAWNWALARTEAARAAAFLTVQPVVGAVLGAGLLGDPVSVYTAVGGVLIVAGLWMSAAAQP
ncbi:MAG TPA: EamA family transporter [Methylomirabilota bacterium]|nr:EamA family transporter [Methylomirabilota bacterium]